MHVYLTILLRISLSATTFLPWLTSGTSFTAHAMLKCENCMKTLQDKQKTQQTTL